MPALKFIMAWLVVRLSAKVTQLSCSFVVDGLLRASLVTAVLKPHVERHKQLLPSHVVDRAVATVLDHRCKERSLDGDCRWTHGRGRRR